MQLREVHSRKQSNASESEVAVGNIILVNDPDHPQTFWKLARVVELIGSAEGQVRGARILVRSTGSTLQHKHCTLWRFMAHHQNHEIKLNP